MISIPLLQATRIESVNERRRRGIFVAPGRKPGDHGPVNIKAREAGERTSGAKNESEVSTTTKLLR